MQLTHSALLLKYNYSAQGFNAQRTVNQQMKPVSCYNRSLNGQFLSWLLNYHQFDELQYLHSQKNRS